MTGKAFFDLIRHEPLKSLAASLVVIASILLILEIFQSFEDMPVLTNAKTPVDSRIKPDVRIDENAPALKEPLFGTWMPANLSDTEIKKSTLDLEVVGILYSSDEKNSQVVIRGAGGQEQVYAVNDTLQGGVIIKRIHHHGVIVLHNGVLEELDLKKESLIFEPPPKPLIKD